METTQVPPKNPRQNPKPSSWCLSPKPVSGVSLPAGCALPHAHSSCQGGSSFSGWLQRENTLLAGVPKESVMSGPWICPSSLRTWFIEVCKVPWAVSAVILLPFQWESSSLICLNMKGITGLFFFLTSTFQFQIPFVTGFVLKCSHSHRPVFPGAPPGLFSFVLSPLQCFLQPLLLSMFMFPWPLTSSHPYLFFSFSSRFSFSLLLIAIPQAFSWTPNEEAAGKNLHVPVKLCSVCSEGMVEMTWVHSCLHWKPEILKIWNLRFQQHRSRNPNLDLPRS